MADALEAYAELLRRRGDIGAAESSVSRAKAIARRFGPRAHERDWGAISGPPIRSMHAVVVEAG